VPYSGGLLQPIAITLAESVPTNTLVLSELDDSSRVVSKQEVIGFFPVFPFTRQVTGRRPTLTKKSHCESLWRVVFGLCFATPAAKCLRFCFWRRIISETSVRPGGSHEESI
jgi:hypothetical protein